MTTHEYMKRVPGITASDDKFYLIYSIYPKDESTLLFIIHHKKQFVEKIIGYRSTKDKAKE